MELTALDVNYQVLGAIQYTSLQWNRKYYEAGTFEIQLVRADYLPGTAFVFTPERPELGVVDKVETKTQVNGEFVMISGFFAEKLLDRNIFYPKFTMNGKASNIAEDAVSGYPPDGFSITVLPADFGDSASVEWLGDDVGKAVYSMLKTKEMSHSVYFDTADERLKYKVWQGKNRTQAQNVDSWALFTEDSVAVTSFKITEDTSDYRNYAVVLYGQTDNPSVLEIDVRKPGEPKRKLFVQKYGTNQTEDEVRQFASERLQEYAAIETADIEVIQDGLFYLRDYDLGDKCDVIDHDLEKAYETRLIGVTEAFEGGKHVIALEFGEKLPTEYSKLNRLVRAMRR